MTPIGVEQTSSGYEVAWQIPGRNQFSIWTTDSSGNFVSFSGMSGTSTALESLETSFHQDLNGDGVIGIPAPTASATGAIPLSNSISHTGLGAFAGNDTFVFNPSLGAAAISNTGRLELIEPNEFSSVVGDKLATLLQDFETGQLPALFQAANDGHDAVVNSGNHGGMTPMNVHIADLHANDFLVR